MRIYRGQRYDFIDTFEYVGRDDRIVLLDGWCSHCAVCGQPFAFYTPTYAVKFQPNRRCSRHHRPGRAVRRLHGPKHANDNA